MKIYFTGAIRAGRHDQKTYYSLVERLKQYGHVLTEHVADPNLGETGENLPEEEIHRRDMAWLHEADAVIAEVTTPSLGVGYEIAKAEEMGKRILCLYRPTAGKSLSAMVRGSKQARVVDYATLEEAFKAISAFLE